MMSYRIIFPIIGALFIAVGINQELGIIEFPKPQAIPVVEKTVCSADDSWVPWQLQIPKIKFVSFVVDTKYKRKKDLWIWRGCLGDKESLGCWIAGHRAVHSFWRLPELQIGDTVVVILTDSRRLVFSISEVRVIKPDDETTIRQIERDNQLILFTCDPPLIANKRLVIGTNLQRS